MNHEPIVPSPDQNAEQPDAWARQQSLVAEMRQLQTSGAPEEQVAAKADEINRNVAELVDSGQVGAEDAWSLSAGDNPYLSREEGYQEPEL